MKVLRCARFSDLKSRTTSMPSQLNVTLSEVETSLRDQAIGYGVTVLRMQWSLWNYDQAVGTTRPTKFGSSSAAINHRLRR